MKKLSNLRVAVLMCDGFEEVEFTEPLAALEKEGATTTVISPNSEKVKAWAHKDWSKSYPVDMTLDKANPADFDALLLPGGVMNPDKLRTHQKAIEFVKHFLTQNKPLAAICHGPWTLVETGLLKHRTLTSYHSIKTDLKNAGANWQDAEVVVDGNLVTSRHPGDLPAFISKMLAIYQQERH